MLQKIQRLYEEEAQKLGNALPNVLLSQNRDRVCAAVQHALGSPLVSCTVSVIVMLDMLKICEEDPLLANTLASNHPRGLCLIRRHLTRLLSAMLYRLGITAARASDMDVLLDICFQIASLFSCRTECLRRFYARIGERAFLLQSDSTVRRGPCSTDLVVLEACVEPCGKERRTCTRVHRCENPMCRDGDYVIEKEVRDMHAEDSCTGTCCGDTLPCASSMRKRYTARSVSQYLVLSSKNCIKLVLDGPEPNLRCSNCRLALSERQCSTSAVFKHSYILHDSTASVRGHSYFPVECGRCVLVGRVVRGSGLQPELCVLGVFARTGESARKMAREKDAENALRSMYRTTHSMFFSDEETHYTLLVILSAFSVATPRVVVYTNEVSYVRHYAMNYFLAFNLDVSVVLELSATETRAGILVVRPDSDVGCQDSAAELVFHVRVENADIDYRYEKPAGGRCWELCSAEDANLHALPYIQKAFLSLRTFFRETISPPRLLNYIHTLVSGLAHITQQSISPADVRFVEALMRSAVVPDVGRHACAGGRGACAGARHKPSSALEIQGRRCRRA